MVDGVDPLPLAVVLASPLPVLRMDKMDRPILVSLARDPAPVEVFEPLNPGSLEVEKTANRPDRTVKVGLSMLPKEGLQIALNDASLTERG
jgi:hypothetical protein